MDLSPSRRGGCASAADARKKLRYAVVSVVFVPIGQVLVQAFGLWFNDYTVASLLQAAIIAVPNFYANRRFVWRVTSRENLRFQVLVFWLALMLGVALATLFTSLVECAMADRAMVYRGAAVFLAQLLGLGIVWVGRFVMLDKWLFRRTHKAPDDDHRLIRGAGMDAVGSLEENNSRLFTLFLAGPKSATQFAGGAASPAAES
ncbi:GtrA family protein [Mycobacterium palustre]|uniref:GtrA family protein n=1 Tax=Mycobacterium palustre TaxID=153971 RepID=UPI001FEABC3B|nr:GtrA family protein [Mycobacterium palustre]